MPRTNNFTTIPHTYSTNLSVGPGTINNLGVKTCKQIININTLYRDNYTSTTATNFIIRLPHPIRKVISMKLFDYHMPQDNYSISNHYNNNNFTIIRHINGIEEHFPIKIQDGIYSFNNIIDLENKINQSINIYSDISDINVSIDELTLKTDIYTDNSSNPFKLDFTFETSQKINRDCNTVKFPNIVINDQLTLGWLLGFRGDYIKTIPSISNPTPQFPSTRTSNHYSRCMNTHKKDINSISLSYLEPDTYRYRSEGLLDLTGERFMLLCVDDFQNNSNTVYMSPFKNQSLLTSNILGKLTDDKNYSLSWPPRIYFGPTEIDKLEITLYDAFGRIYNNNYGDFSLELLIEYIYDGN